MGRKYGKWTGRHSERRYFLRPLFKCTSVNGKSTKGARNIPDASRASPSYETLGETQSMGLFGGSTGLLSETRDG